MTDVSEVITASIIGAEAGREQAGGPPTNGPTKVRLFTTLPYLQGFLCRARLSYHQDDEGSKVFVTSVNFYETTRPSSSRWLLT